MAIRFSLFTLVHLTLFIGSLMCVIILREAWEQCSHSSIEQSVLDTASRDAPDGRRFVMCYGSMVQVWEGDRASETGKVRLLSTLYDDHVARLRFITDDFIVAQINPSYQIYWRRRHPEWWWGHFYRPEVWLAMFFGFTLLWRFINRKNGAVQVENQGRARN